MNIRDVLPHRTDESVYIFSRPYYLSFLPWFAMGFFLILIGILFAFVGASIFPEITTDPLAHNVYVIITSAYFLLIIPFLTVAFIDFYYDIHIVTDQRVIDIDQKALFAREVSTLSLEDVQDATSRNKGILSSIFNFGDVVIRTSGTQQFFEFNNVLHPTEIATIVLDLADQAKERLERGTEEHLVPRGEYKAVINGTVYETTQPLVRMGAIVPHDPGTHGEEAGVSRTPADTASAETPEVPVTAAPASPPEEDLDIVIDEPKAKPKG